MAYDAEAAAKLVWTEVFNRPTGKNPRGIIAKYLRAAYAMQHDTDRLAFAAAAERTLRENLALLDKIIERDQGYIGSDAPPRSLRPGPYNKMASPAAAGIRALLATLGREAG